MATPGTPWIVDREKIVEALTACKGVMTKTARMMGVHYNTLKAKVDKDEDLKQLVKDLRNELDCTMLDAAENTLMFALSKANDDLANALKSSFFILNNKGRERGYARENFTGTEESSKQFCALMSQLSSLQENSDSNK